MRTRDIDVQLATHLVEVRGNKREAVFEILGKDCQPIDHKVIKYDMLHVTPPQGPLDVVAQSAIANADGWVDVDPEVSVLSDVRATQHGPSLAHCMLRGKGHSVCIQ